MAYMNGIMDFSEIKLASGSGQTVGINEIISEGSNWINNAEKVQGTDVMDFANMFVGIGQVLVAVGVVTLLIVSAIMAVKWITATPDKQAKLKQQLIGLVIAAVVIFGAIGIWNLVRGILMDVETSLSLNNNRQYNVITAKYEE